MVMENRGHDETFGVMQIKECAFYQRQTGKYKWFLRNNLPLFRLHERGNAWGSMYGHHSCPRYDSVVSSSAGSQGRPSNFRISAFAGMTIFPFAPDLAANTK
jgi:hypothetical protein